MSDPASPTYSAYSVPSPFSSGSSASYPARSPVSDSFDSLTDSDHHRTVTMEDYSLAYPSPSSSVHVYNDVAYAQTQQDMDMAMMQWSSTETASTNVKRHPSAAPSFQHSHHLQHSAYNQSQELPNEVERMKSLALYIPSSSPSFHPKRQQSPTVIHSPIPIPVPSNLPSHSPSIASHSSHSQQRSHRVHHHFQDTYFPVEVDKWRTSPATSHQPQYPPTYTQTHAHSPSETVTSAYSSSFPGDISQQPSSMQRGVSEYNQRHADRGVQIKQEEVDAYSSVGPYGGQVPHRHHFFDLTASSPKNPMPNHSPHSPFYPPEQLQQRHSQSSYSIQPADLTPTEPSASHPGFESPIDIGFNADGTFEQVVFGSDGSYAEACEPEFVGGDVVEKSEPPMDSLPDSDPDDEWPTQDGVFEIEAPYVAEVGGDNDDAGEREGWTVIMHNDDADDDPDADADGEDDLEIAYSPSGYTAPPPQHHPPQSSQRAGVDLSLSEPQRSGSSINEEPREPEPVDEDDLEGEDDELESEDDDDTRDPEFVLRGTRRPHLSLSYSNLNSAATAGSSSEGRNLRSSGRYNPYPPSYSDGGSGESSSLAQDHYPSPSQSFRSRRNYSHTSVSPSTSEPYSPVSATGTSVPRRRSRPSNSLPIPIPVPNLTKKSRGRRVPTMEDFGNEEDAPAPTPGKGRKKTSGSLAKSMRTYTCDVDGCGKLFARGEHLKRHIRSIHTYEKRKST
ncbi:hypothetical protein H0H93_010606 [Arthromyces matolae]|nr:hypothetical protein H0H93_010606 [Arthromyces matolae]